MAKLLSFVFLSSVVLSLTMSASVDFARNSAGFAVDIYQKSIEDHDGDNIILSPLSIQTCVALAFMGAGGQTAEEMSSGLRLGTLDRTTVAGSFHEILAAYEGSDKLKIANKIYTMTGYEAKPEFNEIATKQFHSEAQSLNFADAGSSANTINSWVEDKTNQKIKDLIKPSSLSADTRMVLVNAIYFKGFWENKFNKDNTQKKPFYLNEEDHVDVDMMSTKAKFAYGRFEDLDATAIDMPYKDSDLSMLVILPNSRTGLKSLEAKLSDINILDLTKNMYKQDVIVNMPKFKIEFSIKLNDVLKKMGMESMFSRNADFSNLLTSPEPLQVSEVIHKAFIDVDEEGAEAAAATAGAVSGRIAKSHFDLDINHPFFFAIIDHSSVAFSGRVKSF
jgi:serpin B